MNSEKLKKELVKVKNYKLQEDGEKAKIEKFFLNGIVDFLCIRSLDKNEEKGFKEFEEEQINDIGIKDLNQLKDNLEYYHVDELLLLLMSHAHEDWICRNAKRFNTHNLKDADKFVPFELLTWDDVQTYYSVLAPILDSMEIEHNEEDLKYRFEGNQLAFLINNGIYSNDYLKCRIKEADNLYKSILMRERRR